MSSFCFVRISSSLFFCSVRNAVWSIFTPCPMEVVPCPEYAVLGCDTQKEGSTTPFFISSKFISTLSAGGCTLVSGCFVIDFSCCFFLKNSSVAIHEDPAPLLPEEEACFFLKNSSVASIDFMSVIY